MSIFDKLSSWGEQADKGNNAFNVHELRISKIENSVIKWKGLFVDASALSAAYPNPLLGDYAWVGATQDTLVVYRCNAKGTWTATTDNPSTQELNLLDYYTKNEINSNLRQKGTSVKTNLRIVEYRTWASQTTGAFKIKLPNSGIGFIKVYISLYKYTTGLSDAVTPSSKQIIISGFIDNSGSWKNFDSILAGKLIIPKIRVGNEGTSPIIVLGETTTDWGEFLFIIVDKVEVDNAAANGDYSTTTISLITSDDGLTLLSSNLSDGNTLLEQRMHINANTSFPTVYKYLADYYLFNPSGVTGAFCLKTPFDKTIGGFITLKVLFFNFEEIGSQTSNTSQELIVSFFNGGDGAIYSLTANSTGGNFITKISIVYDGTNWRILFNDITDIIKFRHVVLMDVTTSFSISKFDISEGFSFSSVSDISSWSEIKKTANITSNAVTLEGKTLDQIVSLSTGFKSALKCNSQFIRNQLKTFFLKLISKNEYPLNIVFNGDSITNFQNANPQEPTIRPLGMYCSDTFEYKLWQMLNYGTYNNNYTIKSEMGNMEFVKSNHATKAVMSGTFINNSIITSLGESGGHANGLHEFYYTKNQNDYIDFTIGKDSVGFSVVIDKYSGSRTDGTNNLTASDSINIYVDGVLKDTVSAVGLYSYQNTRLDYTIAPSLNPIIIRVKNNSANKWMPIWGVEAWKAFCVRPINCGVASSQASYLYNDRNQLIGIQNPDLIIWQGNCLNDAQNITADNAEIAYKNVIEYMLTLNCPIIVLITHPMMDSSNLTINPGLDPNLEDPLQKPNYYYMVTDRLRKVCSAYGVPYVDVANYCKELYGNNMLSANYVDGIHLSVSGHALYTDLLDLIFKFDK